MPEPNAEKFDCNFRMEQFNKFLDTLRVRAGYCVDCLSQLYGEPAEMPGT